jgi:hypothetical protein
MLAVATMSAGSAVADNGSSMSVTPTPAQAQARQFGMYFGGTASQYDLCARKGFLAAGSPPAEEIAKSLLEKMSVSISAADQAYIQEGWDVIKKEISENESFFTQERCAAVGKEWAKMMATVKR